MSEIKDDPREVLVLLNSLGFVGITAAQLKAFMKDLKVYRKVKERERQQRKEEIKAKILGKQQALIKEAFGYQNTEFSPRNNIAPSESSNSFGNESVLKVSIKCIPKEKDVQRQTHSKAVTVNLDEKLTDVKYKQDVAQLPKFTTQHSEQDYVRHYPSSGRSKNESKQNAPKRSTRDCILKERCKDSARIEAQSRQASSVHEYTVNKPVSLERANRPESKTIISDPVGNTRAQSALSVRSSVDSRHKSFIRPWRLQPEAQKNVINRKCDPVALYQKYQQEWKQISFPGEAKHSKIRWAVREKMLGTDPHPTPLPRKSVSMPTLKRK